MGRQGSRAEQSHQHRGYQEQAILEHIGASDRPADMDDFPENRVGVSQAAENPITAKTGNEADIDRHRQELEPADDTAAEAYAGNAQARRAKPAVDEEIVEQRGSPNGKDGDHRDDARPAKGDDEIA